MNTGINHIALVIGSMRMGGAEKASVKLLNEFCSRGIRCDLVLVREEGEFLTELHPDVHVFPLDSRRTLFALPSMRRYLRRVRPQALIAAQTHVQLLTLTACRYERYKLPVILTEHSTFSLNHDRKKMKGLLMRMLAGRLFPLASAITAVSAGVAKDLAEVFPALSEKIRVIGNPVVDEGLLKEEHTGTGIDWVDESRFPVVLAAGRLAEEKDFRTLILSFALLRKKFNARLVILGEGAERAGLEKLASETGYGNDILLYGYTKNVRDWMRKASVFVLSSRREGSPVALVEAIACSCPVVSVDCQSGPSEILKNGLYGTLVAPGDIKALSDAIGDVLNGKRKKFSKEEALGEYRVEFVADRFMELIKEQPG
jgi:glycosyltransferase involved in cell wall biosynthesis